MHPFIFCSSKEKKKFKKERLKYLESYATKAKSIRILNVKLKF